MIAIKYEPLEQDFNRQEQSWFRQGVLGIFPLRAILEYYGKQNVPANAYYTQRISLGTMSQIQEAKHPRESLLSRLNRIFEESYQNSHI
jgi:hypothetical protein